MTRGDDKKPMVGGSHESILDEEMIAQLRDLGALEEILQSFLDEGPRVIAELRDAIDRRDAATLRRTAHTLKGVSAATGAKRIRGAAAHLEEMGRTGVFEGAEQLLGELGPYYKEFAQALEGESTKTN